MTRTTRNHLHDLRGASRLAVDATRSVTDLVEAMHLTIGGGPAMLGRPLLVPTRAITGLVYGSIRGVTRLVGAGVDRALVQLAPLVPEDAPGPRREAVLAVLNGVLGDHLSETGNALAIQMELRQGGRTLEVDRRELRALLPKAGAQAPPPRPRLVSERPEVAQARPRPRRRAGTRPRLHAPLPALQQRPAHLEQRTRPGRAAGTAGRPVARAASTSWSSSATAWADWWRAAPATTPRRRDTAGDRSWRSWSASARPTTARCWSAAEAGSSCCSG